MRKAQHKEARTMEDNNFRPEDRQQLGSSAKVHTALGFLILALLTLLQVKYQNPGNPFQTHGAIMSSFIVLVIGYALTLAGISRPTLNTSYLHIGRNFCLRLAGRDHSTTVENPNPRYFCINVCTVTVCLTSTDSPMLWTNFPINQSIYFGGSQNIVWLGPKWFPIATASSFQSIQLFFNANCNCQLNREPSGKCSN